MATHKSCDECGKSTPHYGSEGRYRCEECGNIKSYGGVRQKGMVSDDPYGHIDRR